MEEKDIIGKKARIINNTGLKKDIYKGTIINSEDNRISLKTSSGKIIIFLNANLLIELN